MGKKSKDRQPQECVETPVVQTISLTSSDCRKAYCRIAGQIVTFSSNGNTLIHTDPITNQVIEGETVRGTCNQVSCCRVTLLTTGGTADHPRFSIEDGACLKKRQCPLLK